MLKYSIRGLAAFSLTAASILHSPASFAQSTADTSFSAWNSAFLVQQSGQAYYATTLHGTAVEGSWVQALDIEVAEDAYLRDRTPTHRQLVNDLLTHFLAYESYDWSLDTWNDDIAWMTLACVRGYQITGNNAFLNKATYAWNMAYNRGWDTSYGGGGIWENMDNFPHGDGHADKCALSTNPFITSGLALYQITGDSSYLTKSQAIYTWVRGNIFNTSTGVVNEGVKWTIGQTNSGVLEVSDNVYNSGSFVQAANYLYRLTGNAQYYNDALLAANHVVNSTSIMSNNGGAQTQWQYRFVKGLSDFATDNNLWPQYQSWMQNNANAAWSKRNSSNLTWNNWLTTTNDPNIDPMESSSAVGIWQVLPNPNLSVSGNFEIVNVGSNMALGVTSNASYASVVQQPYTGSTSQQWTFVQSSGGYCQIKNVSSGLVMNVSAASVLAGAKVIQYAAQSMNPGNDQWLPIVNADGTYSFFNHDSVQALDVTGASTDSGAQLEQYWSNDTNAQKFTLIPLGTIANGTYHLTPACATGSHLDVAAAGTTNGTNVDIYASNTSNAQKWTFTANAAGNGYRISPLSSPGLSLDVAGAGVANGTNVDIWTSNTTSAQKWGLTAVSGGYTLTPLCATGTRLDVAAGASTNFTNVDIYQANGTNAQTWAIAP
ncbi:hypothetical protein CCAX7_13960 [Capsulimonas corticalis]|uniref:Ricin B lectin domain-containing protein n=1 Tax=Capsulimonas corticalis TaxID=2219043 RepID=A0A9N7Q9L7_9BACT|nr:RICIN domain-containing protein [Capsulimonas corticalis]BDI29345.1 hypothetical protein CCAX7_13960 [Capsulimonas corticalis]